MATRLYMGSVAAPDAASPNITDGGWERDSGSFFIGTLKPTKQNTALTTKSALFGATATSQSRYATFISDTLNVDQTISGTFSLVVGKCAETALSDDAHLAYALRVVDGALAPLAVLSTIMATSTEFPLMASAATRIQSAKAITSFNAPAGSRIILEIGVHGVTPANKTVQLRYGDPTATADFALTTALTTDLCPWGEISTNLTFGTPPPPDPLQFVENEASANNSIATSQYVDQTYTSIKGWLRTVEGDFYKLDLPAYTAITCVMTLPSGVDWDLNLKNVGGINLDTSVSTTTTETVSHTNNTSSAINVYLNPFVYSSSQGGNTPYTITLAYESVGSPYQASQTFMVL